MNVTIIGRNNNGGLEKDKIILTRLLQEHHINVDFRNLDEDFIPIRQDTDLCIHLEIVDEQYFGRSNILIPNQEWFMREWLVNINRFDAIFCKSLYAEQIFGAYHSNVIYTGFTSLDCYREGDKIKECFHSSGRSRAKGTRQLIDALKSFDSSRIHIVSSFINEAPFVNECISFYGILPEEEFNHFRNRCLIHIYPSVIEGFGHVINEAMSCASVVLTTDYPPMNELTSSFLIPIDKEYALPDRLGGIAGIAPSSIKEVLDTVLLRDDLHELGLKNREVFLRKDQLFREQFMAALHAL